MFINVRFMLVTNLGFLCPLFIWVGLMGGGSYVNVMYNILNMEKLKQDEKQGALVLSLMFNDIGVLSSAVFTLVIDNTLFKS